MISRIWSLLLATLIFIPVGRAAEHEKRRPHFDIRNDTAETSVAAVKSLRAARSKTARSASGVAATMAEGRSRLMGAVPGLQIETNPVTKAPEVLDASLSGAMLTGPSKARPETVVRGFVSGNAALFGLTKTQAGELETVADYANPAGNLSWVELRQTFNGIPVFQGNLRAAVRKDGAILRTTGNLAGGLDAGSLPTAPKITASEAAVAAAGSLGITTDTTAVRRVSTAAAGKKSTLAAGPFVKEIQAELVYFPIESGVATLAYSMVLWEKRDAWYTLVDAGSGQLLWRKNITNDQTQAATFSVYDSDSPAPLSPTNATPGSGIQGAPVNRTTFTLISELPAFDNLGWITDGGNTTTGNNVDAGFDIDSTNGIDAGGRPIGDPNRVFNFNYVPGGQTGGQSPALAAFRMGAVTNLFFWSNRYHDRLYSYGFTEAARNFQQNNFGRGGTGNDFVIAEAQDGGGTNNANFATPPDGQSGRMQMYVFTGPTPDRDGDLDQEIVLHELTHGLSNRLHANGSGLDSDQAGGMGEGWSDFYARALLATADEDVMGVYAMGAYATRDFFGLGTNNSYYGIRRFPYAVKTSVNGLGKPHNPLTLADVDPGKVFTGDGAFEKSPIFGDSALEVHNVGEIWCMALLEVRARIITRLGFTAGTDRTLQIVTDAMKLDPATPTLIQGRNSIITAAAGDAADIADIWAGFAAVGMGFNASITNTAQLPASVVESFITPNLVLGTIAFSDAGGNNDGFPDPGEPLVLTVPITNLLPTAATGVTAAVAGGAPVSFGTINPSQTVTQEINYTIPPATPSGTRLKRAVAIDSSFGPVGPVPHSFFLIAGHPVNGLAENFDALPGAALPAGWTTSRTGVGVNWSVSTTNSDSQPKNAFTPDVSSTGRAEMVTTAVTMTSPTPQLTFRNSYNMEVTGGNTYWDGMVLEISLDGAPFIDILEAGGEFLSGGYNVTLAFSDNPLSGRNGWGGLSGGSGTTPGYITTKVLLPASAMGKSVRFKWVVGCDESAIASGSAGVRIDGIVVGSRTAIGVSLNRPPVINPQTFSVLEHQPNGFVIGTVAASDPDPGQTLTYSIESGNTGGAFALNSTTGQLTVANSAVLDPQTFSLDVKVTDNATAGGPLSANATVTVNVRLPGVSPSVTGQQPIVSLEDKNRTIVISSFTIDDPDSSPADFILTVLDGTNYTRNGNTITPAANFNGTLTVPVKVTDGESDSAVFNAVVDVTAVNDIPSFAKGPDLPITADGLPRTIDPWATAISTGPPDESAVQVRSFTVTTSNDAFFTVLPTVNSDGVLSFTAAPVIGSVTVTVVIRDDGGVLNGGVDASAGQSFVITSTPVVNDPPSFIVGSDQVAAQDAGPQTVPDFAAAISPGPPDEAAQAANLTFEVTAAQPGLFDVQPAISATGTLTYTPKATASGTTVVTVILNDHGGTENDGDETSDPQTFVIAVTSFTGHDGIYNGLALPALGTPQSAEKTGLIGLKLTEARSFTGKFKIGIDSFTLKGSVDNAGVFHFGKTGDVTLRLERKGRTPYFLELRLDVAGTSDQVNGTLRGETGPAASVILADRAFYSKTVPPPFRGKFTALFDQPVSPDLLAAALPQGDGSASLVVSEKGIATIDGFLADGAKVKYSNTISKTAAWSLYVPFLKGNGALAGRVQFRVVPEISDVDGAGLLWFRPQDLKGKKILYPGGWPKGISTALIGSTYVPGVEVAPAIDPALAPVVIHNANLVFTGGNLSQSLTRVLKLDGKKILSVADKNVTLAFDLKTGKFKGTFLHPTTQKKATLKGAVLQKQKLGSGYFNGEGFSTTGGVVLDPLP